MPFVNVKFPVIILFVGGILFGLYYLNYKDGSSMDFLSSVRYIFESV